MNLITDYLIVEETDRYQMQASVKRHLGQGWMPFGDIKTLYREDSRMTVYTLQMVKLDPSVDPLSLMP